jgi:ornithine decarboxylase
MWSDWVDRTDERLCAVQTMTFDCLDELDKIADECPAPRLVPRIKAVDPAAMVSFGHKYAADPDAEAPELLSAAARRGVKVVGVSFHIGSGAQTGDAYVGAIGAARRVFDAAAALGLPPLRLLDIGGGFYGRFGAAGAVELGGVAASVNGALAVHFPPECSVRIIAEPGRYFADACATMFTLVQTVREKPPVAAPPARPLWPPRRRRRARQCRAAAPVLHRRRRLRFFFHGVVNNNCGPVTARVLRGPGLPPPAPAERAARTLSTVFGPTCNPGDVIYKDCPMPHLRRGDWLQFPNVGAYSIAGASTFNGLPVDKPDVFYVWSKAPVGAREATAVRVRRCGQGGGTAVAAECAPGVPEEDLLFVADRHGLAP